MFLRTSNGNRVIIYVSSSHIVKIDFKEMLILKTALNKHYLSAVSILFYIIIVTEWLLFLLHFVFENAVASIFSLKLGHFILVYP